MSFPVWFASWFRDDPDAAIEYVGNLSPTMQATVASGITWELAEMPEKALAMIGKVGAGQYRSELINRTVSELGKYDPDKALKLLDGLDGENEKKAAIRSLAEGWAERDPEAASSYLLELDEEHRPSAYTYANVANQLARRDPDSAVTWAQSLESDESRESALRSIAGPLIEKSPSAFLDLLANEESEDLQGKLVSSAFSQLIENDPESARRLVDKLPTEHRPFAQDQLIQRVAREDPVAASAQLDDLARELDGDLDKYGLSGSASTVASSWSQVAPEAASQWALGLPDEKTRKTAVEASVTNWLQHDSYEASEWIGGLPEGDTRDAAVSRLVYTLHDDPEAGFAWAKSISDEHDRFERVRQVVRGWKSKDSEAARDAVLNAGFADDTTERLLVELEE